MCYDHSSIDSVHIGVRSTIIMSPRSVCCRAFCSTFDFFRSPSCSTNGRTTEKVRSQLTPFGSQLPTGGHGVYAHTSRFGVGERSTVVVCMHIQQNASVRTYCSSYIHIHHRAVSDECHPPIKIDNWTYSGYRRARAGLLRII